MILVLHGLPGQRTDAPAGGTRRRLTLRQRGLEGRRAVRLRPAKLVCYGPSAFRTGKVLRYCDALAQGVLARQKDGRERLSAKKATGSGLAGRYATALFDLALERGALEKVETDLGADRGRSGASLDLKRMLRSLIVSRDEHQRTLAAFADRLGLGDLVRNFLSLLAQKRRLLALGGVIAQFRLMVAAHRGEETAEVVSAAPLEAGDLDRPARSSPAMPASTSPHASILASWAGSSCGSARG